MDIQLNRDNSSLTTLQLSSLYIFINTFGYSLYSYQFTASLSKWAAPCITWAILTNHWVRAIIMRCNCPCTLYNIAQANITKAYVTPYKSWSGHIPSDRITFTGPVHTLARWNTALALVFTSMRLAEQLRHHVFWQSIYFHKCIA